MSTIARPPCCRRRSRCGGGRRSRTSPYEPFAVAPVARLDELRLAALEQRIEAELALGEHRRLIAELEALADEQPTHERFTAQLMTALYRSGRQEDALAAYRSLRRALVDTFGIEPTPELCQARAGGAHPGSEPRRARAASRLPRPPLAASSSPPVPSRPSRRSPSSQRRWRATCCSSLSWMTKPSWRRPPRACPACAHRSRRAPAPRRSSRAPGARISPASQPPTTSRSSSPTRPPPSSGSSRCPGRSPRCWNARRPTSRCSPAAARDPGAGPVLVGFGGGEHDWAAVELGAWLAQSAAKPLRLLALRRADEPGDATRLLAAASIAVQGAVGIDAEPLLVEPGPQPLIEAAARRPRARARPVAGVAASRPRRGPGARSRPSSRRRCCSCTAARGPAGSPPRPRRPASPGRWANPIARRPLRGPGTGRRPGSPGTPAAAPGTRAGRSSRTRRK